MNLRRLAQPRSPEISRRLLLGMTAVAPLSLWLPRDAKALDLAGYRLTFEETFSTPQERFPDDKFGTNYESWGGLRTLEPNGELQLYVDSDFLDGIGAPASLNPFRFRDGHLEIVAQPTPPDYLAAVSRPYVSGLLTTDNRFAQKYGYFEIVMKAPAGRGLWPAFWLVAQTQDEHLEIDVFEQLGHEPGVFYVSMHAPARDMDFHRKLVFGEGSAPRRVGVEWLPDRIVWYLDRREVALTEVELDVPMYMLANLAVGGRWPGDPDATTSWPAAFEVYALRAYQRVNHAG